MIPGDGYQNLSGISDFGISLPDIPNLTKYENHGVIQIHHLFPDDTEGKNFGRGVGRKKQN